METKALKKQMGAAIAMVLVAAIALAASTYAWFVSNNTVKATTASVSAQSNAPFLKIAAKGAALTDTSATQTAGEDAKTDLYPVQWNDEVTANSYTWESAYASKANASTMLQGSRFAVASANVGDYTLVQSFDIGTTDANAGSFKDLRVSGVTVNAGNIADQTGNNLKDAMCVLVKCGDYWTVWNANGELKAASTDVAANAYGDGTVAPSNLTNNGALAATIAANTKVTVDIYVFYDGSYETVFTNNLPSLKNCGVTVSFTATPVNTDGNEVDVTNDANATA